jgi:acyl-CoA thioesterase I
MKSTIFFHNAISPLLGKGRGRLLLFFLVLSVGAFAQPKIKVACVGNSITVGYGLKPQEAYPAQLQLLLGNKYTVHNYGNSARTLLSKGNLPYIKEKEFREAIEWNPAIVLIKLGTNDSKPINWKYQNDFISDLKAMVKRFRQLPSHPKIYLCYPIPVFSKTPHFHPEWGINDSIIANGIIPKIKTVQKRMHTRLIDLRTPMLGKDSLVFDGIHPNAEGAKTIARIIYKQLTNNEKH